ncbi:MAG: ribbon-helix-helix domain-containing protein [Alphaproteobacteria bacterium]|nr:ribbon-helix-helix domain-containing protein [Alphaproteobacteria bacterium]
MNKLSVSLSGHRTSISLEPEFISALHEIALQRCVSVATIICEIDKTRDKRNLSSALRVWILQNINTIDKK